MILSYLPRMLQRVRYRLVAASVAVDGARIAAVVVARTMLRGSS